MASLSNVNDLPLLLGVDEELLGFYGDPTEDILKKRTVFDLVVPLPAFRWSGRL